MSVISERSDCVISLAEGLTRIVVGGFGFARIVVWRRGRTQQRMRWLVGFHGGFVCGKRCWVGY